MDRIKITKDYKKIDKGRVHITTSCAGAVLQYFGCMGVTYNRRTKHNVYDNVLRRNGYSVRSRMSKIGKGKSVGGIRGQIIKIANNEPEILGFLVSVKSHVLLIDREGNTIVDTAPRKRDRRKVLKLRAVMHK